MSTESSEIEGSRIGAEHETDRRRWERVGRDWTSTDRGGLWRCHADAVNAALLRRWLPRGGVAMLKTDLFDEALGEGQYALMAARSEAVSGIDIADSIVVAAVDRCPRLGGRVADVRRLPFGAARFDAVVSLSTLDHFERRADIDTALRELHRVLRPGGILAVTLDNTANPVVALRALLPHRLLHRVGLVPYFCGPSLGPRSLPAALERAGFEVLERDALMHCPRVLMVPLAGWLERRGGDRARARFLRVAFAFERLGRTALAPFSGHFVAALARRPHAGTPAAPDAAGSRSQGR